LVWNTEGSPTTADSVLDLGPAATTGDFTGDLNSLSPETTYYIRAFAVNEAGTAYGDDIDFTTAAAAAGDGDADNNPTYSRGGGGCFIGSVVE
jgi:hypothetical protein